MFTRRQIIVLTGLVLYWPAIFVATHIPRLPEWVGQVPVSDKVMHFTAYFLLTFLLWYVINPDHKVNWRKPAVWWVLLIVACYGAMDELLQAYVGRHPDLYDFIADMAGAVTALILLSIFHFWPACLILTGSCIFVMTNFLRTNAGDTLSHLEIMLYSGSYAFFSLLWMRYIHHFFKVKPPQMRWLIGALAIPCGMLFGFELFCLIAGHGSNLPANIVSLGGIFIAVISALLYGLFLRNFAEKY
ncbi:MAG: VanZ family protein [Phycisphaerae bacterium]